MRNTDRKKTAEAVKNTQNSLTTKNTCKKDKGNNSTIDNKSSVENDKDKTYSDVITPAMTFYTGLCPSIFENKRNEKVSSEFRDSQKDSAGVVAGQKFARELEDAISKTKSSKPATSQNTQTSTTSGNITPNTEQTLNTETTQQRNTETSNDQRTNARARNEPTYILRYSTVCISMIFSQKIPITPESRQNLTGNTIHTRSSTTRSNPQFCNDDLHINFDIDSRYNTNRLNRNARSSNAPLESIRHLCNDPRNQNTNNSDHNSSASQNRQNRDPSSANTRSNANREIQNTQDGGFDLEYVHIESSPDLKISNVKWVPTRPDSSQQRAQNRGQNAPSTTNSQRTDSRGSSERLRSQASSSSQTRNSLSQTNTVGRNSHSAATNSTRSTHRNPEHITSSTNLDNQSILSSSAQRSSLTSSDSNNLRDSGPLRTSSQPQPLNSSPTRQNRNDPCAMKESENAPGLQSRNRTTDSHRSSTNKNHRMSSSNNGSRVSNDLTRDLHRFNSESRQKSTKSRSSQPSTDNSTKTSAAPCNSEVKKDQKTSSSAIHNKRESATYMNDKEGKRKSSSKKGNCDHDSSIKSESKINDNDKCTTSALQNSISRSSLESRTQTNNTNHHSPANRHNSNTGTRNHTNYMNTSNSQRTLNNQNIQNTTRSRNSNNGSNQNTRNSESGTVSHTYVGTNARTLNMAKNKTENVASTSERSVIIDSCGISSQVAGAIRDLEESMSESEPVILENHDTSESITLDDFYFNSSELDINTGSRNSSRSNARHFRELLDSYPRSEVIGRDFFSSSMNAAVGSELNDLPRYRRLRRNAMIENTFSPANRHFAPQASYNSDLINQEIRNFNSPRHLGSTHNLGNNQRRLPYEHPIFGDSYQNRDSESIYRGLNTNTGYFLEDNFNTPSHSLRQADSFWASSDNTNTGTAFRLNEDPNGNTYDFDFGGSQFNNFSANLPTEVRRTRLDYLNEIMGSLRENRSNRLRPPTNNQTSLLLSTRNQQATQIQSIRDIDELINYDLSTQHNEAQFAIFNNLAPYRRGALASPFLETDSYNMNSPQTSLRVSDYAFEDEYEQILNNLLTNYEPVMRPVSSKFLKTLKCIKRDEGECVICLTNYKNNCSVVELDCEHDFHKECVVSWFRVRNTCPVCRKEVDK